MHDIDDGIEYTDNTHNFYGNVYESECSRRSTS